MESNTMRAKISYQSAIRLLNGRSSNKILKLIDQATVGALAISAIPTHGATLSFFGLRNEVMRLGREKIAEIRDKRHRWSDPDRTDRLVAAHAILVITDYFEVLSKLSMPVDFQELELTDNEKLMLSNSGALDAHENLVHALTADAVPMPTPTQPFESFLTELESFYYRLSERLIAFIEGLSIIERLSETDIGRLRETVRHEVAPSAVRRYQEDFLKLAADCPVFALWANLNDHQATRDAIREMNDDTASRLSALFNAIEGVGSGLAGIDKLLSEARVGNPAYAATTLAVRAANELDWPIVKAQLLDAHPQLEFPKLRDGYINPSGRITDELSHNDLGDDSWWDHLPQSRSLEPILAGLLMEAYDAPIVLLGQPGAGKSLLTKVLTARLSQAGVLAVRVELRHVDANAPIERQIRDGIERATNGEQLSWPELVRAYPQAKRRVVLLDGFDELLQATGVNRSDYLELVQDFQQSEAGFGRHTAILVTSRTVVASRTRFPEGTRVIRLDAFSDEQIAQSLEIWNTVNRRYFRTAHLNPVPIEAVLRHRALAEQPLLLLMLELYDADDNALQKETSKFDISDLYEKMLLRFSHREVMSRGGASRDTEELHIAIEGKLQQLSITAAAMFNRGQQWVSAIELEEDLSHLLPVRPERSRDSLHDPLSEADVTVGGFFFIHKSSAEGLTRRHAYEFMHATMGEYLVARIVWRSLEYLLATAISQSKAWSIAESSRRLDDDFLYALLSFEPLSAREPVIDFLRRCLRRFTAEERNTLRGSLTSLFRVSLFAISRNSFGGYEPIKGRSTTSRLAIYSANLLLIAALLDETPISSMDLFGDSRVEEAWARHTRLWQSQFISRDAWMSFVRVLKVERLWTDGRRRVIQISVPTEEISLHHAPLPIEAWQGWPSTMQDAPKAAAVIKRFSTVDLLREAHFLSDPQAHVLLDLATPMARIEPDIFSVSTLKEDGVLVSPARALLNLLVATSRPDDFSQQVLESVYRRCLLPASYYETQDKSAYLTLILNLLGANIKRVSPRFINEFLADASSACSHEHHRQMIDVITSSINGDTSSKGEPSNSESQNKDDADSRVFFEEDI